MYHKFLERDWYKIQSLLRFPYFWKFLDLSFYLKAHETTKNLASSFLYFYRFYFSYVNVI